MELMHAIFKLNDQFGLYVAYKLSYQDSCHGKKLSQSQSLSGVCLCNI